MLNNMTSTSMLLKNTKIVCVEENIIVKPVKIIFNKEIQNFGIRIILNTKMKRNENEIKPFNKNK